MDFAVIRVAGKQHVVSAGSQIQITGDPKTLEVLLVSKGDKVEIGTPVLENVKVATEVISTGKGPKIDVMKFKAKSRYRRKNGFRPIITTLKITNIGDEKVSTDSGEQPRASKRGTKKSNKV